MLTYFHDIIFAHPKLLYLLLMAPLLVYWYWMRHRSQHAELTLSSTQVFLANKPSLKQRLLHLPFILRTLTIAALIICLARPQSSSHGKNINSEGIDIVLSIDISASMLAEDFKPNRIEAAKKVAAEFIEGRSTDRMGLVIFSGEAFSLCPLTTDHAVLQNQLKGIKSGTLADGTAIGEGLATAVTRIKDSKAKSRVVILLTDGVSNIGVIAPLTAAEIAKTFGIRVYTIGVGTIGTAPYPMRTPFGIQYQNVPVDIDEPTMKAIAENTGGKYFRATGNKKLAEIYKEIDKLEKTKIEVTEFSRHSEEFMPFALAAALFFILELILRYTVLKSIP